MPFANKSLREQRFEVQRESYVSGQLCGMHLCAKYRGSSRGPGSVKRPMYLSVVSVVERGSTVGGHF